MPSEYLLCLGKKENILYLKAGAKENQQQTDEEQQRTDYADQKEGR
jgi:hypothetical protein